MLISMFRRFHVLLPIRFLIRGEKQEVLRSSKRRFLTGELVFGIICLSMVHIKLVAQRHNYVWHHVLLSKPVEIVQQVPLGIWAMKR